MLELEPCMHCGEDCVPAARALGDRPVCLVCSAERMGMVAAVFGELVTTAWERFKAGARKPVSVPLCTPPAKSPETGPK